MINYLLYIITELKGYIILSLITLMILAAFTLLLFARKKRGMADFKMQSIFLFLGKREAFYLTLGISEVIYIISTILMGTNMNQIQLIALAVLVIGRIVFVPKITMIINELICGGLSAFSLITGNLLMDYLSETGFDFYIFTIWLLLSIFVIAYAVYHLISTTGRMAQVHEQSR